MTGSITSVEQNRGCSQSRGKGFPKGFPFEEKKICQDQSLIKFNKWKRGKNSKIRILIARYTRINQTSYNNHVENCGKINMFPQYHRQ